MKIKYIKIVNFRNINSFECNDLSNMNIFAGINGAGKTTVINAIKILLSWLAARIRNSKGNGLPITNEDIKIGQPYCFLKIVLDNGVSWQIYKQRTSVRTTPTDKTDFSGLKEYADLLAEQSQKSGIPLISAYGVNRVIKDTPTRIRKTNMHSPLDAISVTMDNSANFHDFFIWYREMEDIENANFREAGKLVLDPRLQAVRKAIYSISSDYTDFSVKRTSPMGFTIKKNGIKFNFRDLSDGEKAYLTLVMDIARKLSMTHPDIDNPLEADGIIIVDEIDLHLHPTWQREVISMLKSTFSNCQFILTTHSSHIVSSVNSFENDKLFVISNGEVECVETNLYGLESDMVLSEVFNMTSLRNPQVQEHIDNVTKCLASNDFTSDEFNTNLSWLKDRVSHSDAIFANINLKIALLKKQKAS